MGPQGKIRLSEFTKILEMSRETFRAMIPQRRIPFRLDDVDGQRTYDAKDLFAMEIYFVLTRDGSRQDVAARQIIRSGAVAAYYEAPDAGATDGLCLMIPDNDPPAEMQEIYAPKIIQANKIADFLGSAISREKSPGGYPGGLRMMTIVHLDSAFSAAQTRARLAGYILDGESIMKVDQIDDAEGFEL